MKNIKTMALVAVMMLGVATFASGYIAMAQPAQQVQDGVNSIGGSGAPSFTLTVRSLINTFLFLIGAIAVIMIIYGGFKYVTSAGESSALTSAKNTILYAVVGLVVAVSAYSITGFVIGALDSSSEGSRDAAGNANPDPQ